MKSVYFSLSQERQEDILEVVIVAEMAVRMWMHMLVLGSHAMMALGRQRDTCLLLHFLPLVLVAEIRSCAGNFSYKTASLQQDTRTFVSVQLPKVKWKGGEDGSIDS